MCFFPPVEPALILNLDKITPVGEWLPARRGNDCVQLAPECEQYPLVATSGKAVHAVEPGRTRLETFTESSF
jgi:hypothetical protein